MNSEEPVFCIIHNYRRPNARNIRQPDPLLENDSDQFEQIEPISTDDTLQSETPQVRQNRHNEDGE